MTKDEEILLRELAGGRCTIQKVTDAIGPMSLWSKDGLEAEIRRAVEAELEHEIKRMREEMKIKSVTMRCKDYDVALPIIYNYFGRVLVGQPRIPPQRTWAGLTDEELTEIRLKTFDSVATNHEVYRVIEAKLKDKNT